MQGTEGEQRLRKENPPEALHSRLLGLTARPVVLATCEAGLFTSRPTVSRPARTRFTGRLV